MGITVGLLADRLADAPAVADLRWREWGHPPEPTDLEFWLTTTLREAGRDTLPITCVATDDAGLVVGERCSRVRLGPVRRERGHTVDVLTKVLRPARR